MKLLLSIAAPLLFLLTFVPTITGQTCSCKAPDGRPDSCEVKATCPRGCGAVCAPKDACYVACGNFEADLLNVRITLKTNNADSKEIISELTRQTGKRIEFEPKKGKEKISVDLKNSSLFYALSRISKSGRIKVNGTDFEKFKKLRNIMSKGGKVSINFDGVPLKDALDKLSFLSGLTFRVGPGDAEAPVSLSLQNATLKEIVTSISKQSSIKIAQMGKERR